MQHVSQFATTTDYSDDPRWQIHAINLPYADTLWQEFLSIFRIFRFARRTEVLLLSSSSGRFHPDLLAAGVMGLFPRKWRPAIVLMGCMWHKDKSISGKIQQIIVKLADRAIDLYAVQSSEELTLFPQLWGVSPAKMRFCPFFATAIAADMDAPPIQTGQYVFAGGNAQRDYEPFIEAARQMPDVQFVIASKKLRQRPDLPPNLTAAPVSHREFMGLMRHAAAVVVPMRQNLTRAAGQQTYLNAMLFGKPILVTDGPGVHDHIEHGKTGFIIDASPENMTKTLRFVLDPANQAEVAAVSQAAQTVVQREFKFEHHVGHLLKILDEAAILK